MRYQLLALGFAGLLAVGIWQAYAQPRAGGQGAKGAETAELIKHGSYLVHEVAHCGNCHTPKNDQGKSDTSRFLKGATIGFAPKDKSQDWAEEAPDITADGLAGQWSAEEMFKFLMTGVDAAGAAPMAPMPVFHLTERDARAITLYLRSLATAKVPGNAKE